jgi:hypothetical protein
MNQALMNKKCLALPHEEGIQRIQPKQVVVKQSTNTILEELKAHGTVP